MPALPYGFFDFPMAFVLRNVFARENGEASEDMRCAPAMQHDQDGTCVQSSARAALGSTRERDLIAQVLYLHNSECTDRSCCVVALLCLHH
jgi:hypothetical protein